MGNGTAARGDRPSPGGVRNCVKVFKPFEAVERRSSLCNLMLQSFPFLSSSFTSHDYSLFLGAEPFMLVSHLTTRPASEISKLVH